MLDKNTSRKSVENSGLSVIKLSIRRFSKCASFGKSARCRLLCFKDKHQSNNSFAVLFFQLEKSMVVLAGIVVFLVLVN